MDDQLTKQAIEDTLEFVSYAAHRGIPLKEEDIANVVDAQRAGDNLTDTQEKAFWTSATSISKAVSPVTLESLRATRETDINKRDSAAWASRKYRLRTAVTLAILLLFQIYWLIGATVTTDLNDIRKRLATLALEEIALWDVPELKKTDPNYQVQQVKRESNERAFTNKLWVERISAATNFDVLKNWNIAKHILLWGRTPQIKTGVNPSPSTTDDYRVKSSDRYLWEFYTDNVVELQTAQITLTAILKYILPILYGALGASAFIVRTLATEIREHTFSRESTVRYQLRFYLGAVAGLSIAWFTSDPKSVETAGIMQSLSPLALAFLAGYSVELLFSLLDRIVLAFSNAEPVKPKL